MQTIHEFIRSRGTVKKLSSICLLVAGAALMLLPSTACSADDQGGLQNVCSQPSWTMESDQVQLSVTRLGAQMAPVTFYRNDETPVQPYHISPWQGENLDLGYCPVLVPLRGDFFCLPFGGNGTAYQGEQHPPHGETVGSPWSLVGIEKQNGASVLTLELEPAVRKGKVTRQIALVDGENVVYTKATIEGFKGKTTLAHHAILAMPEKPGVIHLSTSPILFGMTCPYPFSNPENGEYQSLAIGAIFDDLSNVPVIFKGQPDADCTSFPSRRGYADLVQTFDAPGKPNTPAWITAVNTENQTLWFALKDPKVMPGRVYWMENHGRYGEPWNGRNSCLGLEDGCTFFDKGIAESISPNIINKQGVPTYVELTGDQPYVVNYIQGVVKVPAGFDKVAEAKFNANGVDFVSTAGQVVTAKLRYEFLFDGKITKTAAE